jgi:hypothetical protein
MFLFPEAAMRWNWGRAVGFFLLTPALGLAGDHTPPSTRPARLESTIQWDQTDQVPHPNGTVRERRIVPGPNGPIEIPVPSTAPSTIETFEERGLEKVPKNWLPFLFNGRTYYIIPCN